MSRFNLLVAVALVAMLPGCARYVVKDSRSGVVAIPSSSNTWPFRFQDKAHKLMAQHFPEGYVIESEQEAVIGETTNIDKKAFGGKTATTTDKTEWRIHYRQRGTYADEFAGSESQFASDEVQRVGYQEQNRR